MISDQAQRIALGKIIGGHGVRGLARVKPYNPDSETLQSTPYFWLEPPSRTSLQPRRFPVVSRRPYKGLYLVGLEGIGSLNDLEPWIGSEIALEETGLAAPEPGEFYQYRAIGLQIRTEAGENVGEVVDILVTNANDVWVVRSENPEAGKPNEILIPVVGEIVLEIDLSARYAVVRPIPGLLEDGSAAKD
jgi:16S rRNA processing protein RimM